MTKASRKKIDEFFQEPSQWCQYVVSVDIILFCTFAVIGFIFAGIGDLSWLIYFGGLGCGILLFFCVALIEYFSDEIKQFFNQIKERY
jgi:hypothetical protein